MIDFLKYHIKLLFSYFTPVPFQHKTRNLCLLLAQTVSAKHWPLLGQVAVCRHRTVPPNHGLVNPESFMETSRFDGALQDIA